MPTTHVNRRALLGGTLGVFAALGLSACSSGGSSSSGVSASASPSTASVAVVVPTIAELTAAVAPKFTQTVYRDSKTGKQLPYNVFLPAGYSAATKYPLVHYIADSSLVGKAVTAPLSQYGALIWAAPADQAKNPSIVVVPEYPAVIIDDHGSFTTTDYVELTARFVNFLQTEYSVDTNRVYGTGQSMGCMTTMHLAAEYPDLFAAQLLVSGQWDVSTLQNLTKEKFVYVAAGGDSNATGGQTEVKQLLTKSGVPFGAQTWDATWSDARLESAARSLLSNDNPANFATFATGSVLTANPGLGMEHMASFEPAYKITALREWLFTQHA